MDIISSCSLYHSVLFGARKLLDERKCWNLWEMTQGNVVVFSAWHASTASFQRATSSLSAPIVEQWSSLWTFPGARLLQRHVSSVLKTGEVLRGRLKFHGWCVPVELWTLEGQGGAEALELDSRGVPLPILSAAHLEPTHVSVNRTSKTTHATRLSHSRVAVLCGFQKLQRSTLRDVAGAEVSLVVAARAVDRRSGARSGLAPQLWCGARRVALSRGCQSRPFPVLPSVASLVVHKDATVSFLLGRSLLQLQRTRERKRRWW